MDPIVIAIIVVLCQYPIAVLTLIKMFRLKWEKTPTIVWNFVIVLLPFIGATIFWIYYLAHRKKLENNRIEKELLQQKEIEKRMAEKKAKEEVSVAEMVDTDTQNGEEKDASDR